MEMETITKSEFKAAYSKIRKFQRENPEYTGVETKADGVANYCFAKRIINESRARKTALERAKAKRWAEKSGLTFGLAKS